MQGSREKSEIKVKVLTLIAIVSLIAAFFSPIWWVSLTAPNYPADVFPDGIKIHFYFSGVKNGCKVVEGARSKEIYEGDLGSDPEAERSAPLAKDAGLDCVHEMDTINHYVGMYPIITGAPLEQALSKYLFAVMVVLLFGFLVMKKSIRLAVLGLGFCGVGGWLFSTEILGGGIARFVEAYQVSLGTYFKDTENIIEMSKTLNDWAHIGVYGILALMVFVFVLVAFSSTLMNYLIFAVSLIPMYFVFDFGAWLWFFGHNLHPWGAFTLKPFMPTIFGEGKVAQFSTFSYPHFGFAFLVVTFGCLVLAVLLRRKNEV